MGLQDVRMPAPEKLIVTRWMIGHAKAAQWAPPGSATLNDKALPPNFLH
jgi:hypothetical protein